MADDIIQLQFGYKGRTYDDVQTGIQAFIDDLRQAWTAEPKQISPILRDYLEQVAEALAKKHGGSTTTPERLAKRTGKSVDSIIKSVNVKGTTWETLTGSIGGQASLAIHEFGGTIRKKDKLLTIPLPAAMKNGRAPLFTRQWKNTFVARSRKGNLIIFQRRGAQIVPLYLLVEEISIRPRLGMRQELKNHVPYFLSRAADKIANDVIQQLGG